MNKYKITSPCTQDWNTMLRVDGGRFCNHCNKTVHDLTDGKDFIPPTTNETFCGRIIDETYVVPKKISFSRLIFWQRMMRLSPLLASLLLGKTTFGQIKDSVVYSKDTIDINTYKQTNAGKIEIIGRIRDKNTLEKIQFAHVKVCEGDTVLISGMTDMDGIFKIELDTAIVKWKTFDVKVSYNGYEGMIVKDIPVSQKDFVVDLKLNSCTMILGMVASTSKVIHVINSNSQIKTNDGKMIDFTEPIPIPIDSRKPLPDGIYINSPDLKKKQK